MSLAKSFSDSQANEGSGICLIRKYVLNCSREVPLRDHVLHTNISQWCLYITAQFTM